MQPYLRSAFLAIGSITMVLAFGFAFQRAWATGLWAWPDSRLTYIFLGSIAAAIAAPVLWIAFSGEMGAAPGGTLNIATIGTTAGIYLLRLYARRGDEQLLAVAIVLLIVAFGAVALFLYSRRIPIRDQRPIPSLVRVSFGIFAAVLIAASTALLLRTAHIFPWPLRGDTSVMIGCIFLGNAVYFLYGLSARYWGEAIGQLIAFIAYDLVLIDPFLRHLNRVLPEHRLSLILYIIILIGSGTLGIYYLLIAPSTRLWGTTRVSTDAV